MDLQALIHFFISDFLRKEVTMMIVPRRQKGQGLVEYGLIIALIAIVVILILTLFGSTIANMYQNVVAAF